VGPVPPCFVVNGRFDETLSRDARATQRSREGADYDAVPVEHEEAARIADLAERFVKAVDEMLTPSP